jgi:hypothetical protein
MWGNHNRQRRESREFYPLSSFAKNDSWKKEDYSDKDEKMKREWKEYLNGRTMNSKGEGMHSSCSVCGVGTSSDGYCKNDSCTECRSHTESQKMVHQKSLEVKATGSFASHHQKPQHHSSCWEGCSSGDREYSMCHSKAEWDAYQRGRMHQRDKMMYGKSSYACNRTSMSPK